ncbi:MAG: hypothetical protein A2928_00840 [Candidatus Taylorbacteria bacterium RIFCSPLOWO2_01_FULL_45_15b]|uniref:Ribonuclease n=1 Tax=Candidatus Taylorbacteria bacterium RIFCSPLOWO2_01_FULL_45_15b TaxID=1802319 RepID=A0A1G2NAA7_9BACT|nr:MAG: hypothetical protein A2928_00840 [Candidatus Taylorbacteria bacterium RIFCSPLOWO2_01_FULL_45_15b]
MSSKNNKKSVIPMFRHWRIGVDEVGRGALAGPLVVGMFVLYKKIKHPLFSSFKDSKKTSKKERVRLYELFVKWRHDGLADFATARISPKLIDKTGLSTCGRIAVHRLCKRMSLPAKSRILLDAGLEAPASYVLQKSIVRGDETIAEIAFASIVAKVTRDREMQRTHRLFPQYHFADNVGYGTLAHRKAVAAFGVCPIHRRTFLRAYLQSNS